MQFENSQAFAARLDQKDRLAKFRDQFIIPQQKGKEKIYFLGNSLGLQPKRTAGYMSDVMCQWAQFGVEGFFQGYIPWLQYHDCLTRPLAEIVGAKPDEIVVMNQLSINLHLMMVSFYRPAGKRTKILCEAKAFPSDQYAIETHLRAHGLHPDEHIIEVAPRNGENTFRTTDILDQIREHQDEVALVLWGGVNYYTGQAFDLKAITAAAHDAGALVGFDLAHAAGNIALELHDWDVDFACWCSYKYLNSGPGAVAGAFIHQRFHKDESIARFAGWWGYEKATRFKMEKGFRPVESAEGWSVSTPAMLLFACHRAALDIFQEAGMKNIVEKGKMLNDYLFFIIDEINRAQPEQIIELLTPRGDGEKGNQVSMFMHQKGREIFTGLGENGIFADWREPNVIRIAPAPLYNTFEEVWKFGQVMQQVLQG